MMAAPKIEVQCITREAAFIVHGPHTKNLASFTKEARVACAHQMKSTCGEGSITTNVRWSNRLAEGSHACIEVTWTSKQEPEELYYAVTGTRLHEDPKAIIEGSGRPMRRGGGRVAAMRARRKNNGYGG